MLTVIAKTLLNALETWALHSYDLCRLLQYYLIPNEPYDHLTAATAPIKLGKGRHVSFVTCEGV